MSNPNKFTEATVITVAFLFSFAFNAIAAPEQETAKTASAKIYFSEPDQFDAPRTYAKSEFDCSDKIFTVIELNSYPLGKYELSVIWQDPVQTTREKTEYPFTVRSVDTRLWAWLSLSRGTGAGMMQWIDPAAGMEEFIGLWTVEVRINGKLIERPQFSVIC